MTFGFSVMKRIVIVAVLLAAVLWLTYPVTSSWWSADGQDYGNLGTLDPNVVVTNPTQTSRIGLCSEHLDPKTNKWVVDQCSDGALLPMASTPAQHP